MKFIQAFESFQLRYEGELNESLYVQRIFEDYEKEIKSMEDDELTSGEKAALTRGMDLLTEAQAAVAYLLALGKSNLIWKTMGLVGLGSTPISVEDLSKQIGMKILSLIYAMKKFKILMGKEEQGSQVIYEKIIKFFNKFDTMNPEDVASIAQAAFTPEAAEKGEEYTQQFSQKKEVKSMEKRKKEFELRQYVNTIINTYGKMGYGYPESKKKAINRVSKEMNIPPAEIEKIVFGG